MKKYTPTYTFLYAFILVILLIKQTKATETPVVLKEWAAFAGNTDSVFVVPVLNEGDYTYIATYTMDSLTGPDIMIVKYDGLKSVENILGKSVIGKVEVLSNSAEIDCSLFAAGIYILVVQYESSVSTFKIIKN